MSFFELKIKELLNQNKNFIALKYCFRGIYKNDLFCLKYLKKKFEKNIKIEKNEIQNRINILLQKYYENDNISKKKKKHIQFEIGWLDMFMNQNKEKGLDRWKNYNVFSSSGILKYYTHLSMETIPCIEAK